MTDAPQNRRLEMQVNLPPELLHGAHADMAHVWWANGTFVLDFGSFANEPVPARNDQTGEDVMLLSVNISTRVRYSAEQIPALIEMLQNQYNAYKANTTRVSINEQLEDLMKLDPDQTS